MQTAQSHPYRLFSLLTLLLAAVGLLLMARGAWAAPTSTSPLISQLSPPNPCSGERFTDVCPDDYFYTAVLSLNDSSIVSGYNSAPPCPDALSLPCFKPYNSISRGQIAKIVSLAAGFNDPVSGQTFEDVNPGSTFYLYIERVYLHGAMFGYSCGGVGEPCGPGNLPFFRVNNPATRGQIAKIVAIAFGWTESVGAQHFQDVSPGSFFFVYIERLYSRGIIRGYPCGGPTEPCHIHCHIDSL